MDVVALGLAKADAAKKYHTLRSARLGRRRDRPLGASVPQLQVMSAPPTIGAITSATAIATGTNWYPMTGMGSSASAYDPAAPFDYVGASNPVHNGTAFPEYNFLRFNTPSFFNVNSAPYCARWVSDAQSFELMFRQYAGQTAQLWIDGQQVSATPITGAASPGQAWLPISWSTRGTHLYEWRSTMPFGGVRTAQTDTVWKPAAVGGPTVVVLGDSYSSGTGSLAPGALGWPQFFSFLMGWPNVIPAAVGGSGYLSPGLGSKFRDRIATDVIPYNPDLVIIAGGHNDTTASNAAYTTAAVQAEAALLYAALRTALPLATLVVTGPMGSPSAAGSQYATLQTAFSTAGAGLVDKVIDTMTKPWFFGTGYADGTTGNGNDDLYMYGTGGLAQHPYQTPGHLYIARRHEAEIVPLLAA